MDSAMIWNLSVTISEEVVKICRYEVVRLWGWLGVVQCVLPWGDMRCEDPILPFNNLS